MTATCARASLRELVSSERRARALEIESIAKMLVVTPSIAAVYTASRAVERGDALVRARGTGEVRDPDTPSSAPSGESAREPNKDRGVAMQAAARTSARDDPHSDRVDHRLCRRRVDPIDLLCGDAVFARGRFDEPLATGCRPSSPRAAQEGERAADQERER